MIPLQLLKNGASKLGIELTDAQLRQFETFAIMLLAANRNFNLTRITDPQEIVTKHFLDSLMCLSAEQVANGAYAIDIGTGPGFPGIPIKIARPDVHITLIDGTAKKIRFVSEVVSRLGLDGVSTIHCRAEELGRDRAHRERYEVAYARALSKMRVLVELCLPFVRVGGVLVATKGPTAGSEIDEAQSLIDELGGTIHNICCTQIPETDINRVIIVIRKVSATPDRYPRPYAQIVGSRKTGSRS